MPAKLRVRPRTPKAITDAVRAFCAHIVPSGEAVVVRVDPAENARPLYCFPNVQRHVASFGGEIVHGWQVFESPGCMLEAHFHAVWRSPSGDLIDVTPENDNEPHLLFLPDPVRRYEGHPRPSYRHALTKDPRIEQLIRLYAAKDLAATDRHREDLSAEIARLIFEINGRRFASLAPGRTPITSAEKIGRNDPCTCGSGRKYKKCCRVA